MPQRRAFASAVVHVFRFQSLCRNFPCMSRRGRRTVRLAPARHRKSPSSYPPPTGCRQSFRFRKKLVIRRACHLIRRFEKNSSTVAAGKTFWLSVSCLAGHVLTGIDSDNISAFVHVPCGNICWSSEQNIYLYGKL